MKSPTRLDNRNVVRINRFVRRVSIVVAVSAAMVGTDSTASAQYTLTTLATFDGANGNVPGAGLIADASGNLYGTTYYGGVNNLNNGTVFKVAALTHTLRTLATFNGANGANPHAGLIADASGNLYGTTEFGGANGQGTVFEVAALRNALSTLATFNGANGARPEAGLIADASGGLYGTTYLGGANSAGTVFKVAALTHALSTLATFNGANGQYPTAGLLADASGNLYGTTYLGGENDDGTVFVMDALTHALSTLATFNNTNGSQPSAGLLADASGNLFGTTIGGGANNGSGTVFELAALTHTLSTLVTFNGPNGNQPYAGLIADASGNLYGTTEFGGDLMLNSGLGDGTVYELAAGTHSLSTLATFNGANGKYPLGGLIADASGNLYGTTGYGGANDAGTVFMLSPVPEPSTLVLAAVGAFGMIVSRRRKAT